MPDFSFLEPLSIDGSTATMILDRVGCPGADAPISLQLRHVGQSKRYRAAVHRLQAKHRKNLEGLEEALLEMDRREYPAQFIAGWSHVREADGTAVPFSVEACRALIARLPDHIFHEIRQFCLEPSNFEGVIDVDEPLEMGKS